MKVEVRPRLLEWARERASLSQESLASHLHVPPERVAEWEETGELTLKQLEGIAHGTYTPIGYLFLPEPPEEQMPIPDFRTVRNQAVHRPSPNLLDTIHQCQLRQNWYREYQIAVAADPLPFVGKSRPTASIEALAREIRGAINIDTRTRASLRTFEETLVQMMEQLEALGVLVMRNSVVGNNTHRALSVDEFRGFVLSDEHAPLIFVNGADSKAAQMFTLAHELVHLWIGESGVSNLNATLPSDSSVETFCNRVAAEILVPLREFKEAWRRGEESMGEVRRLAPRFKVSTLVILRRALDAQFLSRAEFQRLFDEELAFLASLPRGKGGDFYRTQSKRLGWRFTAALIASTREGKTLYREAFQLLGISKASTFNELSRRFNFGA